MLNMSTEAFINSEEVGRLLGHSRRTVHRMAERGEIPVAYKVTGPTGAYLFRLEDVEPLLVGQVRDARARLAILRRRKRKHAGAVR